MKRLGISTPQLLRRRARSEPSRPPAVQIYRDRPGHLSDAGGAYLVLPFGLLHTLSGDRQQHLVDILTDLAATNPRWAASTTYQVLPWTRIRPADLSDEELTWHGITSDIDPTTGSVAYNRAGWSLHPDTIIGHRPAPDTIPAPAGTYPGARPALLPAGPGPETGTRSATAGCLRTERAQRMIETHRRRELLARHAPNADIQWAEAIVAADPLWGPDQDWKVLIDQTTIQAPIPGPPVEDDDDGPVGEESAAPASPSTPRDNAMSGSGDDEAELAALEMDLQSLYRS